MPQREIDLDSPLDLRQTLAPLHFEGPVAQLSSHDATVVGRTPEGAASMRIALVDDRVHAEAWGPGADELLGALPGLIGAGDDPTALEPHHEIIRRAQRTFPGLRIPAAGLVYESLVPTILGQRVSGLEAARGLRALTRHFGEDAPGPGGHRLLPAPERLAGMNYAALHPCGIERARARALIAVAREADRLQRAFDASPEDGERRLGAIRGIGPWTVACVSAATTGDPDIVAPGDYNLPHLVSWALAGERRGTDERMFALLAPYSGQRGRVLRLLHAAGAAPPRRAPRAAARDFARH